MAREDCVAACGERRAAREDLLLEADRGAFTWPEGRAHENEA